MTNCAICDSGLSAKFNEMRSQGHGRRVISRTLGISERQIKKHYSHGNDFSAVEGMETAPAGWAGGVEIEGDTGTVCSGPTRDVLDKNYDSLLKIWNLNPDLFEVIEPVTYKAWDGFIKNKFKEIETVRLYSYKARVQRKIAEENRLDVSHWRKSLLGLTYVPEVISGEGSYVTLVADSQFGKPGTQEALESWRNGLKAHLGRALTYNISEFVLAFMGDETENIANNYASQTYEIELNQSEQLELDLDMRIWSIKLAVELGVPVRVISVPSNHGEFSRNGSSKPITSIFDNTSTMIARMAKQAFDVVGHNITWNIAKDEPDVVVDISGIKSYFAHGHIAKGRGSRQEQKVESAVERQILGRRKELYDLQLAFTAHYHHYWNSEDKDLTVFGCPALESEKSSSWYFDQYGVWSPPGMLGMLVGKQVERRGWNELAIF